MKIRCMTYNICSGHDYQNGQKYDPLCFAPVIARYAPDVLGLNEVRGQGTAADYTEMAQLLGEALGYHWFFAPIIRFDGGPYGNALLSRYPILKAELVRIPDPPVHDEDQYYESRGVIRAELDIPGGFTALISHFGLAHSEEKNAVETVRNLRGTVSGRGVFMGDLNMEPADPNLAPLFACMADTSAILPDHPASWPSWAPEKRIDYIFTLGGAKALDAFIPAERASDHRPYVADLEI